ncbi:GNAT family N-acetyltransferase [Streptomyces bambusae]|uniref:GNAT family N-acetyltransferase n=1 Tax=Streptomyces bambusae TaxID=1550616 RepID=UPI001CFE86E9|nr:GNAT family N-acetyltransferase [Streptomyces bambusae]MCB5167719.1 GNAT family N-acetyltransferase [Streptomyces bambusae]
MTERPPQTWQLRDDAEVAACARVLAAAFAAEPATHWIAGRSPRVRAAWFLATLRTHAGLPGARRHLLTDPAGRPVGAAVLTPPATRPAPAAQAAWAARTLRHCGPRPLLRTLRYLHASEAAAVDGAWTLEFIGVAPHSAGRGAGRRLLDHVLTATPAPGGLYLTTADPANVPLYRHFGFTTLRTPAVGPLATTAMWRPATTG